MRHGVLASVRRGRFWRDRPARWGRRALHGALAQATAVSRPSAGRQTSSPGMMRSEGTCSTLWCVGPSSPRPMESCVKTWMTRSFISAAMRMALRL
jgi:hypothetical protein